MDIVIEGGGKVFKTAKEDVSVPEFNALLAPLSDPIYALVPDVDVFKAFYQKTKEKIESSDKKPTMFTVEGILVL